MVGARSQPQQHNFQDLGFALSGAGSGGGMMMGNMNGMQPGGGMQMPPAMNREMMVMMRNATQGMGRGGRQ